MIVTEQIFYSSATAGTYLLTSTNSSTIAVLGSVKSKETALANSSGCVMVFGSVAGAMGLIISVFTQEVQIAQTRKPKS